MQKVPVDTRSCVLLTITLLFQKVNVHDASIDVKHFMEVLGTLAGISTVIYNGIKTLGELSKLMRKLSSWIKVKETPKSSNMTFLQVVTEVRHRWTADSPILFKKFQRFGIGCLSCGFTAVIPEMIIPKNVMERIHWPLWINTYGGYFIIAGFCIFCLSKLPVSDAAALPNTSKKAEDAPQP